MKVIAKTAATTAAQMIQADRNEIERAAQRSRTSLGVDEMRAAVPKSAPGRRESPEVGEAIVPMSARGEHNETTLSADVAREATVPASVPSAKRGIPWVDNKAEESVRT